MKNTQILLKFRKLLNEKSSALISLVSLLIKRATFLISLSRFFVKVIAHR